MKFDQDAQIPLSKLIKRNVGPVVAIDILTFLLERAGLGLHPDRILVAPNGHIEVQAGLPTPGYRAPDYQGGAPRPIHDVYVAGVILYELLAGQNLGQLPEREMLHSGALERALNDMPGGIPTNLKPVLKGMLAFRPEARLDAKLASNELKRCRPEGQNLSDLASVLVDPGHANRSGATLIPGPSATLVPDVDTPLEPPAEPYQPLPVDPPPAPPTTTSNRTLIVVAGVLVGLLLTCMGGLIVVAGVVVLLKSHG